MARQIKKSGMTGGSGGSAWDDGTLTHSPANVGIKSINILHGRQVNNIQVNYLLADGTTYIRGSKAPARGRAKGSLEYRHSEQLYLGRERND